MNKIQFILAGYLPYFSLSQWSFGWYSPYGCVIVSSKTECNSYSISYTVNNRRNRLTCNALTISDLQRNEDLLIKALSKKYI